MSRYTSRYEGGLHTNDYRTRGDICPWPKPTDQPDVFMYRCQNNAVCSLAKTGLPSFCPMLLVLLQFYVFAQIHAYVTIITMVYVRIAIFPKSRATNVRNMSGTVGAWAATM